MNVQLENKEPVWRFAFRDRMPVSSASRKVPNWI